MKIDSWVIIGFVVMTTDYIEPNYLWWGSLKTRLSAWLCLTC